MATSALLAGASAGAQTATPTMATLPTSMNVNKTTSTGGTTTPQNLPVTGAVTGALAGAQVAKPVPVITAQPAITQLNTAKQTMQNAQQQIAQQSANKVAATAPLAIPKGTTLAQPNQPAQQPTPVTPQPMTGISAADLMAGKIDANGNPIQQTPQTNEVGKPRYLDEYETQMQKNQDQADQAYQSFQNSITQLQNGTFPLNPTQQAQVDALKGQYQQLIEQQKIANKNYEGGIAQTNITSGRSRYAPEIALGITMNAVNAGIQKIANIETEMNSAVANMQMGFQTNNMKLVQSAYEAYQQHAQAKNDQITKVYTAVANAAKDARDYNYQLEKDNQELAKWNIGKQMEIDKFDYQKGQDTIKNALAEKKITMDQANQLMDYQIKMRQLEKESYIVTKDAMDQPVAFNTRTGQFGTTLVNKAATEAGINAPQALAFADAVARLGTKDQNERFTQQIDRLLKIGDVQRAKSFLMDAATQSAGQAQKDQVFARNSAIDALNNISTLINAYVQKTGDTGVLTGGIEKAANKIGRTNDPDLANISTQISLALQNYRKGMSGTAFSEAEALEYAKIFPDISNINKLNASKIKSLLDAFTLNQKSFYKTSIGDINYDQIFGRPVFQNIDSFKLENPDKYEQIKNYAISKDWDEAKTLEFINSVDMSSGFNQVGGDTNTASLGSLSQKYESSGNPGAIGYDSTGGWSYGTYQLAHDNARRFVEQSPYAQEFAGIPFNSPEFRSKWKQVAQQDPQGFAQAQEQYIAKTHFEPLAAKAAQAGLDLSERSPVVAEAIFSTGVQHGPGTDVVNKAIAKVGSDASDADLIKAIYAERWGNGLRFASSTPQVKKAVYNRFFGKNGELATALKQLNTG